MATVATSQAPNTYDSSIAPSPQVDGEDHNDNLSSVTSPSIAKKARPSKGTMPAVVKRSISTPNVRSLASTDTSTMSMAEKRRNKLGYHRTSVACGHCRRRKIRCLLAPDDAQGRCSNCIRLKKECNFFPVDQQPQLDRRNRSGSKAEATTNEASTSSSSSPAMPGGHVIDQVDNYHTYPPVALTGGPDVPQFVSPFGSTTMSPMSRVTPTQGYDLSHPFDRTASWETSPFVDQSPIPPVSAKSQSDEHATAYWRAAESPMTPAHPQQFAAPHSIAHPYSQAPNMRFAVPAAREDINWPHHPSRTMSLVSAEDLPPQYHQSEYPQPQFHDFKRRMTSTSDMYPPSLENSNNSSNASISEPQSAPLTGTFPVQPLHTSNFPQAWTAFPGNQHPGMIGKGPESFSGWYAEPPQLAQVKEEEFSSGFHGRTNPYAPQAQ